MVSKPSGDWSREDRTVEAARQAGGVALKALSAGASGIVRVRAAYQACVSAVVAVVSGFAALTSGLIGMNIPIAILAGGCSLLMGWVALRNMRVALGRPRSSVEEADPRRGQDSWASTNGMARDTEINTRRGGSVIYYNRTKLFMRAANAFVACAVVVWVLTANMHRGQPATLLLLPVLGFYLWRVTGLLLRCTDKDLTAVSWDDHQIRVRTLTSSRQVPWQSVESVQTVRRVVRANFIITVSKSYEMVFRLRHNGSRRKMKINAGALTISAVAADQLVQVALRRAQAGNHSTSVNDPPDFSSRKMAATPDLSARELDPVFAHDTAERPRAFGAKGQTTVAPPSFGRKVI